MRGIANGSHDFQGERSSGAPPKTLNRIRLPTRRRSVFCEQMEVIKVRNTAAYRREEASSGVKGMNLGPRKRDAFCLVKYVGPGVHSSLAGARGDKMASLRQRVLRFLPSTRFQLNLLSSFFIATPIQRSADQPSRELAANDNRSRHA